MVHVGVIPTFTDRLQGGFSVVTQTVVVDVAGRDVLFRGKAVVLLALQKVEDDYRAGRQIQSSDVDRVKELLMPVTRCDYRNGRLALRYRGMDTGRLLRKLRAQLRHLGRPDSDRNDVPAHAVHVVRELQRRSRQRAVLTTS